MSKFSDAEKLWKAESEKSTRPRKNNCRVLLLLDTTCLSFLDWLGNEIRNMVGYWTICSPSRNARLWSDWWICLWKSKIDWLPSVLYSQY